MKNLGEFMTDKNARLARITRRLGWAAVILWPGLTTVQLALFSLSSSYRESAQTALYTIKVSGNPLAAGIPWFWLFAQIGGLCAFGWIGCWAWRIVRYVRRRAAGGAQ